MTACGKAQQFGLAENTGRELAGLAQPFGIEEHPVEGSRRLIHDDLTDADAGLQNWQARPEYQLSVP